MRWTQDICQFQTIHTRVLKTWLMRNLCAVRTAQNAPRLAMLFQLTKYGVSALINDPDYASNMPIYDGVLSDEEIIAVLSYIKSTWPEEIRARHTEMENRQ